ncbi:hypothetical protein BCR36DRAFT_277386, partial [Piromyces finnis]
FSDFENNNIDIQVKIKSCNNAFINQLTDSSRIKSCYQPVCNPSCNHGKCINNNLCKCHDTLYTGKFCNEYYQLERIGILDTIIRIITIILLFIIIMLIFITLKYRKNKNIKSGIFNSRKKNMKISLSGMYASIIIILSFHIIMASIWIRYDLLDITIEKTTKFREYKKCSYPSISKIRLNTIKKIYFNIYIY